MADTRTLDTCQTCFASSSTTLKFCSCRQVSYCSTACQRTAWPSHKKACKLHRKHKTFERKLLSSPEQPGCQAVLKTIEGDAPALRAIFDTMENDEERSFLATATYDGKTMVQLAVGTYTNSTATLEIVQFLVAQGADTLATTTPENQTLLHILAATLTCTVVYDSEPLAELVQWLANADGGRCDADGGRCDIHARDRNDCTALHTAATKGNLVLLSLFAKDIGMDVHAVSNDGGTALHLAAKHAHQFVQAAAFDVLKWLVEDAGMDVNVQTSRHGSALFECCKQGDKAANLFGATKLAMALNADVNALCKVSGARPAHMCAGNGHMKMLHMLEATGKLRLDYTTGFAEGYCAGVTPLCCAIMGQQPTCALWMLAVCAGGGTGGNVLTSSFVNVAEPSTATPPLFFACEQQQWELCCALLAAGADPKQAKVDGSTALHISSQLGNVDIVRTLVKAGVRK